MKAKLVILKTEDLGIDGDNLLDHLVKQKIVAKVQVNGLIAIARHNTNKTTMQKELLKSGRRD